jgi:hypothetical protein
MGTRIFIAGLRRDPGRGLRMRRAYRGDAGRAFPMSLRIAEMLSDREDPFLITSLRNEVKCTHVP